MFYIVALNGCPYSEGAVKLLDNLHVKYIAKWIDSDDKSNYKKGNRTTFPQISFIVKTPPTKLKQKTPSISANNEEIYIGGLDELNNLVAVTTQLKEHQYDGKIILPLLSLMK